MRTVSSRASIMSSATDMLSPAWMVPSVTLALTSPSFITNFHLTSWAPMEARLTWIVGQKVVSAPMVQFQSSWDSMKPMSPSGGGGGGAGGGGGGGGNCPSYRSTSGRFWPMWLGLLPLLAVSPYPSCPLSFFLPQSYRIVWGCEGGEGEYQRLSRRGDSGGGGGGERGF